MRSEETKRNDRADDAAAFESRVTAALERRPAVVIPGDFAVRVMSRLPEKQSARRSFSAGRAIGYVCVVLLALGLLLLAMLNPAAFGAGKSFAFGIEMLLVAELLGVGLWLGTRRDAWEE